MTPTTLAALTRILVSVAALAIALSVQKAAAVTVEGVWALLRAQAEQGDATAQVIVGSMYSNGEGVPEDDTEAVRWYRLAAEQGHAGAQDNLAGMLALGHGVPPDMVQAYAWSSVAAAQGYVQAKKLKEILAEEMTRPQIDEAQKLSREYWDLYVVPFQ